MSSLIAIPALRDNYIWLLHSDGLAFVVDPGESAPVERALHNMHLTLRAVLLTHHHGDHVAGAPALAKRYDVPIYGPADDHISGLDYPLREGEKVKIPEMQNEFSVIGIPGHTLGHIAYYGSGILFCGDTMFSAGCGRLFEGTASQMYTSLNKLAVLPGDTQVCCGHEYTLANLAFAACVEPGNADIQKATDHARQLRNQGKPTLPALLSFECRTNPFLRCHLPTVQQSASQHAGKTITDPVDTFAVIRRWKDQFN